MNLTLLQSLTEHISLEIYCLKCWYPVCFCTGTDSPVMGHGPVRVRVGVYVSVCVCVCVCVCVDVWVHGYVSACV